MSDVRHCDNAACTRTRRPRDTLGTWVTVSADSNTTVVVAPHRELHFCGTPCLLGWASRVEGKRR
jgi:hypothetical protein